MLVHGLFDGCLPARSFVAPLVSSARSICRAESDARYGSFDFRAAHAAAPADLQLLLDNTESLPFRRRGYERDGMLKTVLERSGFLEAYQAARAGAGAKAEALAPVAASSARLRVLDVSINHLGARGVKALAAALIDSTPPTSTRSASPAAIWRDPIIAASSDDPQSLLTVLPGMLVGNPASRVAIRATLRLSSPAPLAIRRLPS